MRTVLALFLGVALGSAPRRAAGQVADTAVVAAGARYRASGFHRLIIGDHYRDLWTMPMRVRVLDLDSFAGGLSPVRGGGGRQTQSLRFRGEDGREYTFRSVDKDPSGLLDPALRETVLADLLQDATSAQHPLGPLVAARLLDAVDVLHVEPRLRLMPDDARLGEFREDFAGLLGLIEESPDENDGGKAAFRGAARVVGSEALMERLDDGSADRIDARGFLTARLMDVFLGDWDRHRDQWRWATFSEDPVRRWLPVPRDRDQVFSRYDGFATRIVGLYRPQFVVFGSTYPDAVRLHWNGRELDRRFLSGLARSDWDSVGAWVQARLTDDVIDDAVRRLPPEIRALNGPELGAILKSRRETLPGAWDDLYRLLAERVDIHGTDAADVATVERPDARSVVVTFSDPESGDARYLRRRFVAEETDEVRLYMRGGDDRVVVSGDGAPPIRVRVIGGEGDDRFEVDGADGVTIYDQSGRNTVSGGAGLRPDAKPFREWRWSEDDRDQPRDWGSSGVPLFWSSYSTDLGLFLGGGLDHRRYGFRRRPDAVSLAVRAGYSVARHTGRLEVDARRNGENSPTFGWLELRVSGLDVLHYYGFGNDTPSGSVRAHRVDEHRADIALGVGLSSGTGASVAAGLVASAASAGDNEGRLFASVRDTLYGAAGFTEVGGSVRVAFDPPIDGRRRAAAVRASWEAEVYPALADVEAAFATTSGEVSALLAPSRFAALALRAGGEKGWGRLPWREAAFLGGVSTIAGWAEQRFAGDASVWGSIELRLGAVRPRIVVPTDVGVFGLVDAGRVYLDGASPGGWHASVGGGVWFTPMGQANMLRAAFAVGEESTRIFVTLGRPF